MKDWRDHYVFKLTSKEECIKRSKAPSDELHTTRILSLFRDVLVAPRPLTTYVFSKKAIEKAATIKDLDFSYMHTDKTEIGVCIADELKYIGFVYVLTDKYLKMVVISGKDNSGVTYGPHVISGCMIIDFKKSSQEVCRNSLMDIAEYVWMENYTCSKELRKPIDQLIRSVKLMKQGKPTTPALQKKFQDLVDHDKGCALYIDTALRMFAFLKNMPTEIKIIDTPPNNPHKKESIKDLKERGIIVVDANWNSETHVLCPFSVCGHFRNQPYKDEEGKWQKKLIIIEPFTKKGYHRRATKDIKFKQEPK